MQLSYFWRCAGFISGAARPGVWILHLHSEPRNNIILVSAAGKTFVRGWIYEGGEDAKAVFSCAFDERLGN